MSFLILAWALVSIVAKGETEVWALETTTVQGESVCVVRGVSLGVSISLISTLLFLLPHPQPLSKCLNGTQKSGIVSLVWMFQSSVAARWESFLNFPWMVLKDPNRSQDKIPPAGAPERRHVYLESSWNRSNFVDSCGGAVGCALRAPAFAQSMCGICFTRIRCCKKSQTDVPPWFDPIGPPVLS